MITLTERHMHMIENSDVDFYQYNTDSGAYFFLTKKNIMVMIRYKQQVGVMRCSWDAIAQMLDDTLFERPPYAQWAVLSTSSHMVVIDGVVRFFDNTINLSKTIEDIMGVFAEPSLVDPLTNYLESKRQGKNTVW